MAIVIIINILPAIDHCHQLLLTYEFSFYRSTFSIYCHLGIIRMMMRILDNGNDDNYKKGH